MPDLTQIESSQSVKVAGGNEESYASVSPNNDLFTRDILNVSALDSVINLTTSPTELKVGISNLSERKYVIMEALSNNVKWGFSSGTQSFDLFKSQLLMVPTGASISIWARMSSGTGQIAFGELS